MSRISFPRKLGFLLEKFSQKLFPESARTKMGLAAFLFSGDVKIAVKVSKTPSRGKNFRKKSFLKFSIRLWVWFFETPGEEFPTGFSKLHFSCPEGNLKKKQFLIKTFPQEFCDFEQSNFWTFNKVFFGSLVDITFSVSRVTFREKVFKIN